MAKQWTELEKLVIKKGDRRSNATSLHPKTGTVATITVYSPDSPGRGVAYVSVSADGETFRQFMHREKIVKIEPDCACDIPLPACKSMRLEVSMAAEEDLVFQ